MRGLDLLGVETAIPTAGATYSDAKTVAAVQAALNAKNYGPLVVDGLFGPKTKAAIKKLQGDLGMTQGGKIDAGVLMALQVTPGVLPPGVSIQDAAAVQAQVALDAATAAEHASTPDEVQAAAQQAVDAAPPAPPELKQAAQRALAKAKAASTPAQTQAAADDTKKAAEGIHNAVKPSWFSLPAWDGGPPRWQVGLGGLAALVGLGTLVAAFGGGEPRARGWKQGRGWKSEGHRLRYTASYGKWRDRQNARLK